MLNEKHERDDSPTWGKGEVMKGTFTTEELEVIRLVLDDTAKRILESPYLYPGCKWTNEEIAKLLWCVAPALEENPAPALAAALKAILSYTICGGAVYDGDECLANARAALTAAGEEVE